MTFHLCPVKDGELDFDVSECGLLEPAGSAAYSKYLLRNLTSATLPMPSKFCSNCATDTTSSGVCGYNPGCLGDGPDGFAVLDITLEPSQVAMDHGDLVCHWFTANNGEGFVGGEEFMNCADVRVSPSGSGPGPTAVPSSTTSAHATLTKPVTRNRGPLDGKGPADYQSGNGGGKGFNAGYQSGSGSSPCGDGLWGFSNNQGGGGVGWHYRGGDAKDASLHESWKLMLKDYNPSLTEDVRQIYIQGQNIEVQVQITAYHGGFMTFHLCPVKDGELDFDVS